MTPSDDEGLREEIEVIHKLMFQPSYVVIYPETEMENGYKVAKRIQALISQKIIEAQLAAEILQADAIKATYELYSHDATPFYKTLCEAIENKKARYATLTTKQNTKETTDE